MSQEVNRSRCNVCGSSSGPYESNHYPASLPAAPRVTISITPQLLLVYAENIKDVQRSNHFQNVRDCIKRIDELLSHVDPMFIRTINRITTVDIPYPADFDSKWKSETILNEVVEHYHSQGWEKVAFFNQSIQFGMRVPSPPSKYS